MNIFFPLTFLVVNLLIQSFPPKYVLLDKAMLCQKINLQSAMAPNESQGKILFEIDLNRDPPCSDREDGGREQVHLFYLNIEDADLIPDLNSPIIENNENSYRSSSSQFLLDLNM